MLNYIRYYWGILFIVAHITQTQPTDRPNDWMTDRNKNNSVSTFAVAIFESTTERRDDDVGISFEVVASVVCRVE